ncbi:radical SAM protein [Micromonospora sp. NPDC007271]|uniref:radical SAM protein n=1 Tax=Micromonospora sp. NPDC007271 TaxID=3154587 RepID=UPI0033F533FE
MTSSVDTAPSMAVPGSARHRSRDAFRRYAVEVLGRILDHAVLTVGDREVRPTGVRVRSHSGDRPVDPVEPAGDLSAPIDGQLAALVRITVPRVAGEARWTARWRTSTGEVGEWALPAPPPSDDFTFSYPVPPEPGPVDLTAGPAELYAATLGVLLDAVELVDGNEPLLVDGLRVGQRHVPLPPVEPETHPDLGGRLELPGGKLQPLHTVAATEPAIVAVARHWALLASLLTVEPDPRRLPMAGDAPDGRITGFTLRHLSGWLIDSECHPSEIYEYLARVCNVACQFCYLFGNPDDLAVARGKKVIAQDEIDTRLRYFDVTGGQTLFKSQWEINEFLVDPKLPQVLRTLRAATDKEFYFITNGSPLLPRVIDLLDEVRPVTLVISTNTIDAPLRQQVMNERRTQTETALSCLERLSELEIPFGLSFVATPEFPVERLEEALAKIEPLRPAMVRVNLPGFTRAHPYNLPADMERRWEQSARDIAGLRERYRTPIVIIPSAFEANTLFADPHEARIAGAVPGSPAAHAGFQPGDVVEKIGMFTISSRAQIQSLVMTLRRPAAVVVRRGDHRIELTLDPDAPTQYPYTGHLIGKYVVPYGLVVAPSLSLGDARVIDHAIETTGAQRPWLLTSRLMEVQARSFMARWLPERSEMIHYVVVANEYLGGNIQVLDMATVGDLHRAIRLDIERLGTRPDLILLPGTGFNQEGRDIAGRHWGDLERALRIPVRLLDVTTQFLF